ncbi:MAG: glutathione metabolism protein [Caulobacter sp.]|nr:glutathione metabolism protein [Caulobacter sp.]
MLVIPLYAAALAPLFCLLSVRVILVRRGRRLGFGTGGDEAVERRIRVHANFAEYAPLALLLLFMAESIGAPTVWLHVLGVALVFGRYAHAAFVSSKATDNLGRILGMTGSLTAILGGSGLIIWASLSPP